MKVFNALFGEITGVFGKAYMLAGLLPAFVLVFLTSWYWSDDTAAKLITTLVAATEDTVGELAASALLALVLGLVFFAARSWILDTLQTWPGPRLRWINELLVYQQLRRRMAATRDKDLQDHHLTIVGPWITTRDFIEPRYLPPFERVPSPAELAQSSREARDLFGALRTTFMRPPRGSECRRMLKGLRAVYAYASAHYRSKECRSEIDLWRFETGKPGAMGVIGALQDHVHRTWVDSTRQNENFPLENKWLGPTKLGSRSAALDDYAKDRYGIDTSMMLSRLGGVLSTEEKDSLVDSQLSVETLVNLSVAMAAFAAIVIGTSARCIVAHRFALERLAFDWRAAAFLAVSVGAAIVFYGGAVRAFAGLAEKTMRAVDLNRLELLKKLGFAIPADMSAERELWSQLAEFLSPGRVKPLVPDPPLQRPT